MVISPNLRPSFYNKISNLNNIHKASYLLQYQSIWKYNANVSNIMLDNHDARLLYTILLLFLSFSLDLPLLGSCIARNNCVIKTQGHILLKWAFFYASKYKDLVFLLFGLASNKWDTYPLKGVSWDTYTPQRVPHGPWPTREPFSLDATT